MIPFLNVAPPIPHPSHLRSPFLFVFGSGGSRATIFYRAHFFIQKGAEEMVSQTNLMEVGRYFDKKAGLFFYPVKKF